MKLRESAVAVLPVSACLLALHFTLAPMPLWTLIMFLTGTALLIVGMSLFTLGADLSMMPIGEAIGSELTRSRKLWLILGCALLLGVVVTIAEPDLQLLTKQVPAVPDMTLVMAVAGGVGLFLMIALMRILFHVRMSILLLVSYALVFLVAAVASPAFLAVAFDSGGVTTGPITVPFILAMGAGVSAVRGGKSSEEDSFGICALCSIGPVLSVLLMGLFFDPSVSGFAFDAGGEVAGLTEMLRALASGWAAFFREVLLVLMPVVAIFLVFQFVRLRMPFRRLVRIVIGLIYTLVGLSVFLTGANLGFMPAGSAIAKALAVHHRWTLVPLGALIGFFLVYAEPAVHLLNRQVEEITSGAISRKMMMTGLSIGVGAAAALSIVRVLTGISVWWFLLPGYALALAMTFYSPRIFTAIAFDSGGVAAGTMTAAFLLPFAVGVCEAVGGNVMTDAFGAVGMVAMMPLITVQAMGVIYQRKLSRSRFLERQEQLSQEAELGEEDAAVQPAACEEDVATTLAEGAALSGVLGDEGVDSTPVEGAALSMMIDEEADAPVLPEADEPSAEECEPEAAAREDAVRAAPAVDEGAAIMSEGDMPMETAPPETEDGPSADAPVGGGGL